MLSYTMYFYICHRTRLVLKAGECKAENTIFCIEAQFVYNNVVNCNEQPLT